MQYLFSSQAKSSEKPAPNKDALSIAEGSGKLGKVFFRVDNTSVCKAKAKKATSSPFVLELDSTGSNHQETDVRAVLGSRTGPTIARLRVLILREVTHKAQVLNIFDPASKKATTVTAPGSLATVEAGVAKHWKAVVAKAKLNGSLKPVPVAYDHYKSGTMVTGMDEKTPGELEVFKQVGSAPITVVLVSKLEQAFFLTKDASPKDKKLFVRKTGSDSVRSVAYVLRDTAGNQETVTIKKVTSTTGEVELVGSVKGTYSVKNDAAIFHELAGQTVTHGSQLILYVIPSSLSDFIHTVAHELGHSPGNLAGSAEIANLMCDEGGSGTGLRYRPLKLYYKPASRQSQWKAFKR